MKLILYKLVFSVFNALMLSPLRPHSAAEREDRCIVASLVSSFLPPPFPSLHSSIHPSTPSPLLTRTPICASPPPA